MATSGKRIIEYNAVTNLNAGDSFILERGDGTGTKRTLLSTILEWIKSNIIARVLIVNCGTITSLPTTIYRSDIKSDMYVEAFEFGNGSAKKSAWTVKTTNGSLTISGSMSGSTTLVLHLAHGKESIDG